MAGAGQKALVLAPLDRLADAELLDSDVAAVHTVSLRFIRVRSVAHYGA
jgi:hypothetical protein